MPRNDLSASQPSRPLIVVIDDDARRRASIVRALERRYDADYGIVGLEDLETVADELTRIREDGAEVAMIIAPQQMQADTATSVLARTRDLFPTSRRVVVTGWGDTQARPAIARASLVGDVDHFVGWPWSVSDEPFQAAIGGILAEWATEHGRYAEVMKLVADPGDAEAQVLRETLVRWGVPLGYHDTQSDEGRRLAEDFDLGGRLPVLILPNGRAISRPSLADVADALGVNAAPLPITYDLVIVGSGPAGLAAAVYGVSEGLRTLVIEPAGLGGQASSSPQIRNYLGFPGGVSGAELMSRALQQAWTFGAEFLVGRSVARIERGPGEHTVVLDDGSHASTRSVVLAMGVSYRRMENPSVEGLLGRGVFYGSGATEGPAVAEADVFVVGGGNSAAEAVVHLAKYARSVMLVIRGSSLDDVADYLIQQLEDRPNIEVLLETEIAEARGGGRLESLVLRNRSDGTEQVREAFAVFILIGGTPRTDWLPEEIVRDPRGFVLTGDDVPGGSDRDEPVQTLETSVPGIFAAGDVRYGSVKRVAAAVGEGATTVRQIHGYLSQARTVTAERAK
jgi:thioredoxin reductase (NADPH)